MRLLKRRGYLRVFYFIILKTKKNLFLFAFDYSAERCTEEFYKKVDFDETDFFAKIRNIASLKMELSYKYPYIFRFFEVIYGEQCTEIAADLEERKKKITESNFDKVFNNIDVSKFRDGVDTSRAINVVMWTLEGFATRELQKARFSESRKLNYPKTLEEMDIYLDMFKKYFY